jgi:hypothetical protein
MAISTMFSDVQVAEGLFYAADNGARVVSMSFGVYPSWMYWNFAIIEAALAYCHDKAAPPPPRPRRPCPVHTGRPGDRHSERRRD